MYARKSIEVWYLKSPDHEWTLKEGTVNFASVEDAVKFIQALKKLTPWNEYAYRVITVTRTYVIDHSE